MSIGKNIVITYAIALATMACSAHGAEHPMTIEIPGAPLPMNILVQSPAETITDLQAICLFASSPVNELHGSLTELDQKLDGLLVRIRKPELFRGVLGETLVITPPGKDISARRLLLIGLGDSETFDPQRMQLVGEILYREAGNLGVEHPFFAPTILDGGVTKFPTGQVAESVILGFLRAAAIDKVVNGGASTSPVKSLTFLAGAKNATNTCDGIVKAISIPAGK